MRAARQSTPLLFVIECLNKRYTRTCGMHMKQPRSLHAKNIMVSRQRAR